MTRVCPGCNQIRVDNGNWKMRYNVKTGAPTHRRCSVCDERGTKPQSANKTSKYK